jgi:uncharacterized RDD family membrane protein YckC
VTGAIVPYDIKRRREVVTAEGLALTFVVASRGARFGAFVLDYLILLVSSIGFTLLMAYATPGKRLARIRVAARAGHGEGAARLTAEAVIARNLLRDIELFVPLALLMVAPTGETGSAGLAAAAWFLIFLLFPFFNKDALRAGDVVAGTWVVEAPRARLPQTLSTEGAARGASAVTGARYSFGEAELAVYGEYELQTLERVLRDGQPQALASVHEAICRKIGWEPGAGDERAFLEAYYAQLRARLEGGMRFGRRKKDKFAGEDRPLPPT